MAGDLRRVQKTGGSSYTVTLPKEWVERSKVSSGDVVRVTALPDGSLSVAPASRPRQNERFILNVGDQSPEAIFRKIVGAYISGYDVISVQSPILKEAARKAVRLAAKRIVGIEIVEEDARSIVLQDLLDPREYDVGRALRRMQALTQAMQESSVRAFHEAVDVDDLGDMDDEVDRLHWMINKQYHAILRDPAYAQKLGIGPAAALNFLLAARLVERTADHARRIAQNLGVLREETLKAQLGTRIEKQARRAFQLFTRSLDAFKARDAAAADRIIEEAESFRQAQEALLRDSLSLGGGRVAHVAYALESIARTAAYAADISEVAINHAVAPDT